MRVFVLSAVLVGLQAVSGAQQLRTGSDTARPRQEPAQQVSRNGANNPARDVVRNPAHDPANKMAAGLRAMIASGRDRDLRWPIFSDFRTPIETLYERSGYGLVWVHDGKPTAQALQMATILEHADREGLIGEDYDAAKWDRRLAALQAAHMPEDEVRFDLALTVSTMRFVTDLWSGRTNPQNIEYGVEEERKVFDVSTYVQLSLVEGSDLVTAIGSVDPPLEKFHQLRGALVKYIRYVKEDDGAKLPIPGHIVFSGMTYAGVPRLTRLLRLIGDLPADAAIPADSQLYSPALADAVRHFQKRHGLSPGGYLDKATLEQLNVPLSYRLEQIRLALEHYRWLRYDFPQPPIIINIPESRLYALNEDGGVGLTMSVDVGQEYTRTPVMADRLEYLVFRPYWKVPLDIQRDEIVSNIQINPNYLKQGHFEVINAGGEVVTDARVSNEVLQHLRAGTMHVRQRPGSDNSMGLVKFVFPNRYSVYLHDTPNWENFFAKADRDVSHGCIHLKDPDKLAAWVLRDDPEWSLERVQRAMHEGKDDFKVDLANPIPVLIIYVTAVVGEDGEVYFYRDIYGYDKELHQALAKGYPPR